MAVAFVRVGRHRLVDDGGEPLQLPLGVAVRLQDAAEKPHPTFVADPQKLRDVFAAESFRQKSSGDGFEEGHAHRIDVHAEIGHEAPELLPRFGGHISGRSVEIAEGGEAIQFVMVESETEIRQTVVALFIHEDIARLDVAVDDPMKMRVEYERRQFDRLLMDVPRFLGIKEAAQVARHVLKDEERFRIGRCPVVQDLDGASRSHALRKSGLVEKTRIRESEDRFPFEGLSDENPIGRLVSDPIHAGHRADADCLRVFIGMVLAFTDPVKTGEERLGGFVVLRSQSLELKQGPEAVADLMADVVSPGDALQIDLNAGQMGAGDIRCRQVPLKMMHGIQDLPRRSRQRRLKDVLEAHCMLAELKGGHLHSGGYRQ